MENLIKDFYCGLCSLQLDNRIVFEMHQSIVHGMAIKIKEEPVVSENKSRAEKKLIKCNNCDATFTTRHGLKTHIASIHEGKKPYKCEMLNATFTQKLTLQKHIKSVMKERSHTSVILVIQVLRTNFI